MIGFFPERMVAAIFLALAGCGGMPVSSMMALRHVDPRTTDPAQMQFALRTPEKLETNGGGAFLTLEFDDGEARRFDLVEIAENGPSLRPYRRDGARIRTYSIAPADLDAFARHRAGGGDHGSLSVDADFCLRGDTGEGKLPISTFLRTAETSGYVPLALDVDMRGKALIPAC